MPCCPRPDNTPLDPDREGPSEHDIQRFGGDDLPYTEFPDETDDPRVLHKPSPLRIAAPAIATVAIVALVLVFIL